MSGVALHDEKGASWRLMLQQKGELLPDAQTKRMLAELGPLLQEAFHEITGEDKDGKIIGRHKSTGLRPGFWDRAKYFESSPTIS